MVMMRRFVMSGGGSGIQMGLPQPKFPSPARLP